MKNFMNFDAHAQSIFEGDESNALAFNSLLINAGNGIYEDYSAQETNQIIRNTFDKLFGIDWQTATPMKRRQAYRANANAFYTIIEDIIVDKMVSGWGEDPFFNQFVEEKNLANGDENEFYVEDNSLMQVSKFAGNHHDLVRQKVGVGKSFRVETSWYGIKCYTDFELFRAGKIDFAKLVQKMYDSINKYRKDAVYTAFLSAEDVLPTDLVLDTPISTATVDDIIALAEEVKSCTGRDVVFVGTKIALSKLSKTVSYDLFSDSMKNELHTTGSLGMWEGYQLLAIPRVNEINSRTEVTDNTKIFIVPIDPEFKPIKLVNEGDVAYYETGMNGEAKDMTISGEVQYKEGIAVVINQLYGVINITASVSA